MKQKLLLCYDLFIKLYDLSMIVLLAYALMLSLIVYTPEIIFIKRTLSKLFCKRISIFL